MKKYIIFPMVAFGFVSPMANAAGFGKKLTDYISSSTNKSGVFIGVDQNMNEITSFTSYYQETAANLYEKNTPYQNNKFSDAEATLTYGLRFYLPMKKSKLSNVGIGFKGWYTDSLKASITRPIYYPNPEYQTDLNIKVNVQTIGYEGQIYYDFLNFSTKKVQHAIGLAVGVGTETKSFSNYTITRSDNIDPQYWEGFKSFKLTSLIYDVSLYYMLANHVRIEAGYKQTNYSANDQKLTNVKNGNNFISESSFKPSNGYYYIGYSLQF